MNADLKIFALAEALAGYASARQGVLARNVAHADTPGWAAQDLTPFEDTYAARAAREDGLGFRPAATRAGHVAFDAGSGAGAASGAEAETVETGAVIAPNGNSVSLEDQMVLAAHTRLQHDMALGVWRKSLDILRASLGPPR